MLRRSSPSLSNVHVVRHEVNLHTNAAKLSCDGECINGVSGKAAYLAGDNQVEFSVSGVVQHSHKRGTLFCKRSGNAFVNVAPDQLPIRVVLQLVIVPLHLVAERVLLLFVLCGNSTVKDHAAVTVAV